MTTAAQNSKQILAQKGTAATPSFSFLGGNTTGAYLAGTNQYGIATAGVNAVTIDASQNVTITNALTIGSLVTPTVVGGTTASSSLTLKSTSGVGTSDSILFKVGNNGATTALTIDTSGNASLAANLTFSGTGQRITGDFSNATFVNRLAFQTSTANSNTNVYAIPNGTGVASGWNAWNNSDPTNASYIRILANSTSYTAVESGKAGTGTYLPMTFFTGGSEQMRIGATAGTDLGTVGIGYSTLTGVGLNGLAVAGNVGIGTSSPGSYGAKFAVSDGTVVIVVNPYAAGLTGYVGTSTNHALALATNNLERMRIDSSGNVGIGTSSPGNKLTVAAAGTYQVRVISTTGGTEYYDFGRDPSDGLFAINGAQTTFVGYKWNINGSERMRIDSSGNVGIGTSSPSSYGGTYKKVLSISLTDQNLTLGAYYQGGIGQYSFINSSTGTASAAADLAFQAGSSETMRITSSGNVGIGTASPASYGLLAVKKDQTADTAITVSNAGTANAATTMSFSLNEAGTSQGWLRRYRDGTANTEIGFSDALLFTGNVTGSKAERMRIDSSGNLLVGTTSAAGNGFTLYPFGSGGGPLLVWNRATTTNSTTACEFRNATVSSGAITYTNTTTTYGTSSDYRLKHSVTPIITGLATVAALKPVTYKWNADNSDGEGFIAHELQSVIPHAVTGEKDAVDADGKPIHQGVDYSKIVVHLVAAIQELSAKNDALEARLAKLENV